MEKTNAHKRPPLFAPVGREMREIPFRAHRFYLGKRLGTVRNARSANTCFPCFPFPSGTVNEEAEGRFASRESAAAAQKLDNPSSTDNYPLNSGSRFEAWHGSLPLSESSRASSFIRFTSGHFKLFNAAAGFQGLRTSAAFRLGRRRNLPRGKILQSVTDQSKKARVHDENRRYYSSTQRE